MPSPLPTSHPLRKVAILVASLEATEAERLLESLPTATATAVLAAAEQLDSIDPAEQAGIIQEFRRGMAAELMAGAPPAVDDTVATPPVSAGGVEIEPSLLARLETSSENLDVPVHSTTLLESEPALPIRQADPAVLAQRLAQEHPQTIAMIVSRFAPARAAQVLSSFSTDLQAEVLGRLVEREHMDPQAVSAVEAQLSEWLLQQEQQKQRFATGLEQVQRILESAPPAQHTAIMAHIRRVQPALASRIRPALPEVAPEIQAEVPPVLVEPAPASPPQSPPPPVWENPLGILEQASDHALLTALRATDRQIVLLALAGASETLLRRICRDMSRRQAKQFRRQLRSPGPTRLGDMLEAQQQLARQVVKKHASSAHPE